MSKDGPGIPGRESSRDPGPEAGLHEESPLILQLKAKFRGQGVGRDKVDLGGRSLKFTTLLFQVLFMTFD